MGSKVCADTATRLLTTGKIRGIEEMPHFWARKPRAYKDQLPTTKNQIPRFSAVLSFAPSTFACQAESYDQNKNKKRNFSAQFGFEFVS
jgi:hypothetical protein